MSRKFSIIFALGAALVGSACADNNVSGPIVNPDGDARPQVSPRSTPERVPLPENAFRHKRPHFVAVYDQNGRLHSIRPIPQKAIAMHRDSLRAMFARKRLVSPPASRSLSGPGTATSPQSASVASGWQYMGGEYDERGKWVDTWSDESDPNYLYIVQYADGNRRNQTIYGFDTSGNMQWTDATSYHEYHGYVLAEEYMEAVAVGDTINYPEASTNYLHGSAGAGVTLTPSILSAADGYQFVRFNQQHLAVCGASEGYGQSAARFSLTSTAAASDPCLEALLGFGGNALGMAVFAYAFRSVPHPMLLRRAVGYGVRTVGYGYMAWRDCRA